MAAVVDTRSYSHSGYPIRVQKRALELRRAGWKMTEVIVLLEREFGAAPAQATLSRWCSPGQQKREAISSPRRAARRRAQTSGGRPQHIPQSPEFKLTRMAGLRAFGLPDRHIARVIEFDYGDPLRADDVTLALALNVYPDLRLR